MNPKSYLRLSIVLNLIFILVLVYQNRWRFDDYFRTNKNDEIVDISQMNKVVVPKYFVLDSQRELPALRILVLGNSLAQHGKAPEIGWNYVSGMAASSPDADYVHVLFRKLSSSYTKYNIIMKVSNFSEYERLPEQLDVSSNYVAEMIAFKPDVIIYQFGENVDPLKHSQFNMKIKTLSTAFVNNPKLFLTTSFMPSRDRNENSLRLANEIGAALVDFSHLSIVEPRTLAKNEDYKVNKKEWKSDGIGVHPGDFGMKMIADLLFVNIRSQID